jgi:uncharacterized membrane protein YgaE (UPF0421/DUF939 family)
MKNSIRNTMLNYGRRGLQTAIVVALSFQAGYICTGYVNQDSALFASMWAMVSGLVVLQDTWAETKIAAFGRVMGALVGASIAGGYLCYFPFSAHGLAICAALAVMLGIITGMADGGRGAGVTVVIVMIVAAVHPDNHPLIGAGLRFLESCLGTASALLVSFIWVRIAKHWHLFPGLKPTQGKEP